MDEDVNELVSDLELVGLTSGLPWDVCSGAVVSILQGVIDLRFGCPSRGVFIERR